MISSRTYVTRRLQKVLLLTLGLVLGIFATRAAQAKGTLVFQSIMDGLERRNFVFKASKTSLPTRIHAFRINPEKYAFRVVQPTNASTSTAHRLAREHNLLLAVNASFFDPAGKPLGLLIDQGHKTQGLRSVDWGVFSVSSTGKVSVNHTREFQPLDPVEAAFQAGPRLVVDGRPLKLKPQFGRRTALCIDTAEHVIVVVTESGILLADLAEIMARSPGDGGLGCVDAMNLDGGSSTQATLLHPNHPWDLIGGANVPVVLGIQPRITRSSHD